jgi:hypothetical protein
MFGTSRFPVKLWKLAVILECLDVTAVVLCALSLEIPDLLELAWIAPLISQALAVVAILQTSRCALAEKVKDLAALLLITAFLMVIFSSLFLVLSLKGYLPRLMYVQCTLYILSLAVIFNFKLESERKLTGGSDRRTRSIGDESYQMVPRSRRQGEGLLLPKAYVPGRSHSFQTVE